MDHDHNHGPGEECAVCASGSVEAYIAKCEQTIRQFGWVCQGVIGDPPYTYSIGMSKLGFPEIIVVGFDPKLSTWLINHVGTLMKSGHEFTDWTRSTEVITNYPVYFREVRSRSVEENCGLLERMTEVGLAASPHRMLQLFLPDKEGKFPWQKCTPMFRKQYDLDLMYETIATKKRINAK